MNRWSKKKAWNNLTQPFKNDFYTNNTEKNDVSILKKACFKNRSV